MARALLKLFCRKNYLEEVNGDLLEVFEWRVSSIGPRKARLRYFLDVFSALRMMKISVKVGFGFSRYMLFSFIKTAFRSFKRNRSYTALNLFGLVLGMASALFILEYVSDELNYDQFEGAENMYRISQDFVRNNERIYKTAVTTGALAPALIKDLPKVEVVARLLDYTRVWNGKNIFTLSGDSEQSFVEPEAFFADPDIIELFDLKLLLGSVKLDEPNTVLLSPDMAEKYFGSIEKAIGQTIQFSSVKDKPTLIVTGVYAYPNTNMQVSPAALVSFVTLNNEGRNGIYTMWGVNSSLTYVRLEEGSQQAVFESDLANLLLKYNPLESEEAKNGFRTGALLVTPIKDIHLNSTYEDEVGAVGNATTVRILSIIAIFIVVIAWVNYINLATAHSLNRLREVGVRKVMGAKKGEIVIQFFTEALIMNILALFLAFGTVLLGQSLFNQFVDKVLNLEGIDFIRFGKPVALTFISGVVLSGLYPLTVVSSFGTVSALKGKSRGNLGSGLRKGLIVFQFLTSSLLIIGTIAINRQLNFMTSEDKGMNLGQVLVLDGPTVKNDDRKLHAQRRELLLGNLKKLPSVRQAGVSNIIPGKSILQTNTISRENNVEAPTANYEFVTGSEYLSILNMQFIAGAGFNSSLNREEGTTEVIISRSAAKGMGFSDPTESIGESVYRWYHGGVSSAALIVGVVEDYHHEALDKPIDPMIFYAGNAWDSHYLVKLEGNNLAVAIEEIEQAYASVFPENPVNYYFLDQFYQRQYQNEEVNSNVFMAFAIIAIVVACLGLFGLSSFSALQRTKEIGVRKVLGAGVNSVFFLLAKELLLLATLGFLIATPLGYFGMGQWLDGFAYHISISSSLFFVPLVMIVLLAVLAISPKVIKIALMNPVKSLKHE